MGLCLFFSFFFPSSSLVDANFLFFIFYFYFYFFSFFFFVSSISLTEANCVHVAFLKGYPFHVKVRAPPSRSSALRYIDIDAPLSCVVVCHKKSLSHSHHHSSNIYEYIALERMPLRSNRLLRTCSGSRWSLSLFCQMLMIEADQDPMFALNNFLNHLSSRLVFCRVLKACRRLEACSRSVHSR
jgi:hypothetical protein